MGLFVGFNGANDWMQKLIQAWRADHPIHNPDLAAKFSRLDFNYRTSSGSTTFTIKASDVLQSGWGCLLNLNWAFMAEDHYTVPSSGNTGTEKLTVTGNYTGSGYSVITIIAYHWHSVSHGHHWMWWWNKDGQGWHPENPSINGYEITESAQLGPDGLFITIAPKSGMPDTNEYWYIHCFNPKNPGFTLSTNRNLFFIITLNGKIMPPGRMKVLDDRGSVQLDISKYCNISKVSNTSNTISIILVNAYPFANGIGHIVSGSIEQYKRLDILENL